MALLSRIVYSVILIGTLTVVVAIVTPDEMAPATQAGSGQQVEPVDAGNAAPDTTSVAREPGTFKVPTSTGKPWRVATEDILEK